MGVRESLVPIENAARRRTQYQIVKELCRRLSFLTPRGRDNEPAVSSVEEWFPRNELADGSSLFFIVRSFPSRLDFEDRYFDLG